MSDKTEEPTPKRLRKAEQEGNLPVSAALVSASPSTSSFHTIAPPLDTA